MAPETDRPLAASDPGLAVSRTIWKYPLDDRLTYGPDHVVTIPMPLGAEALCVQMQGDEPTLWALVRPQADTEDRRFVVIGTGFDIPAGVGRYVGTWQQWADTIGAPLVFHLFEAGR